MCVHADRMAETGWQAIGRVAKARRERLGLNQDELALYGGPRVATVGKFERAAQASFPLRTQHQIENALGWSRGTVEDFVNAVDEGDAHLGDWEHELVTMDVPDLSRPAPGGNRAPDLDEALTTLAGVLRRVDPAQLDAAVRAALVAIIPFLSLRDGGDGDAEDELTARRSAPTSRDYTGVLPSALGELDDAAQDDDPHDIEAEQGHDESP